MNLTTILLTLTLLALSVEAQEYQRMSLKITKAQKELNVLYKKVGKEMEPLVKKSFRSQQHAMTLLTVSH